MGYSQESADQEKAFAFAFALQPRRSANKEVE